jgi:ligand-binding sensor domain-containing protein
LAYVMRGILILLACCRCASALNPSLDISQYAHNAWPVRDGFFKSSIRSIAQTPDGYLWLGTTTGLLRFDGIRSLPWQPPAGEHLPGNLVTQLLVARDGRLWIGTMQGLASWKDGKLTHYPEFAGQFVAPLLEDREGTVWVSSSATRGGRLCEIHSGEAHCYGEDGSLGPGVGSLYEDSAGNLWGGGLASLWRWKPGPPKLYRMPDPELSVHALIEGDSGDILIALRSGVRRLVNGKTEVLPLPVRQVDPRAFLRDRNGALWIGTDAGLLHIHEGKTDLFARSDGLSGDLVVSLFEDREGNIWVATSDGLDRFRDFAVATISLRQGLSNASAVTVLADKDGSVWIGTAEGLDRWKDGQITIYSKRTAGLPDDYVESLFQDDRGRVWVSTLRGLAYFENGRFISISGVPGRYVHCIGDDSARNLWISHEQGILHLVGGSVVDRIPWVRLGRKGQSVTLSPDPVHGGIWLGFYDGGVAYFKDGQVRASYTGADGLGEGHIFDLQLDQDGTLWAAAESGLSRVKNGRVATLTSKNGLPCDGVHGMVEDDGHSFWLYSACGLTRIARSELDAAINDSKRTIQASVFDSSDGVMIDAFPISSFSPRFAKSTDGRLWFVNGGGVSVIDPRHLPFNKLLAPVHIEQITADRKTYWRNSQGDASPVSQLPALVRDISID